MSKAAAVPTKTGGKGVFKTVTGMVHLAEDKTYTTSEGEVRSFQVVHIITDEGDLVDVTSWRGRIEEDKTIKAVVEYSYKQVDKTRPPREYRNVKAFKQA